MKKQCVIISTPFQLLSAFSIADNSKGYETDLYIIGNFKNYTEIASRIRNTNVFINVVAYNLNEIRLAQNCKYGFLRSAFRQISYLKYKKSGKRIAVPERKYDSVYCAAAVSATELLLYFQYKYQPSFHLFDDGVMTYRKLDWVTGNLERIQFVKKRIYKRIGKIEFDYYVYLPSLFNVLNPTETGVKRLVPLSNDIKDKVVDVFQIDKSLRIKERLLVIESKVSDYLSEESSAKLEKLYDQIIKITNGDVLFKRHPRDERSLKPDRNYLSGSTPFELFSCIQDMSQKAILAWDSTAVLTPKLFYGQEPKIILLYRLIEGKISNYKETDGFYSEFAKLYKSERRFLIPKNYRELEEILVHLND